MTIKLEAFSCGYASGFRLESVSMAWQGNLTVVGPNGSGKSTLAKALCGLLPYEGALFLDDVRLPSGHVRARNIAYIPAKLEVFDPYVTVEEFVLMGRFAHKKSYAAYSALDREKTHEAMKRVDILALSQMRLGTLSMGQQQLVLLAQALAQESRWLVFDEPTAHLDPKNSRFFVSLRESLKATHGMITITHDLNLAKHLGDAVLFIHQGRADFYAHETFFEPQELSRLYDAPFWSSGGNIGVLYA